MLAGMQVRCGSAVLTAVSPVPPTPPLQAAYVPYSGLVSTGYKEAVGERIFYAHVGFVSLLLLLPTAVAALQHASPIMKED